MAITVRAPEAPGRAGPGPHGGGGGPQGAQTPAPQRVAPGATAAAVVHRAIRHAHYSIRDDQA